MNVTGGLAGITLNENARNLYFLISAELVRLTEEAKQMTSDSVTARKRHHEPSQDFLKKKKKKKKQQNYIPNAQKLLIINPYSYQENDIINLVTKAVMPEKIKRDICRIEGVVVAKIVTII